MLHEGDDNLPGEAPDVAPFVGRPVAPRTRCPEEWFVTVVADRESHAYASCWTPRS